MDKYDAKLMPKAERDIDGIYEYLARNKETPEIALNLVDEIEKRNPTTFPLVFGYHDSCTGSAAVV